MALLLACSQKDIRNHRTASPKEWWGFYLAALVLLAIFSSIAALLYFITNQLGITLPFLKILYTHPWITLGIVNYILLIPIVSVTFRRLQDTNASPWPLVCIFFTAIFLFYMKFPFKTPIGVVVWSIIGAGYIYYVFYRLCIRDNRLQQIWTTAITLKAQTVGIITTIMIKEIAMETVLMHIIITSIKKKFTGRLSKECFKKFSIRFIKNYVIITCIVFIHSNN